MILARIQGSISRPLMGAALGTFVAEEATRMAARMRSTDIRAE